MEVQVEGVFIILGEQDRERQRRRREGGNGKGKQTDEVTTSASCGRKHCSSPQE